MRWTVRLRLTLFYSGLFLVAGVLLVTLIYFLVEYSPFPTPPDAPTAPDAPAPPDASAPPGALTPSVAPEPPAAPEPPVADPSTTPEQQENLRRLLVNSLIALVVMAFASMALGWLMAGRVLRPLGEMTATVRHITADRLDRRLAVAGPDDELKELADTFDELLDRLEAAFTAQRRFAANVSHELRTPLTLQQTMAEIALTDPDADTGSLRAVLERLLAAGRHQERLIEALLTLARSQQGLHHRRPLDLAEIAGQALDRRGETGPRVTSVLRPASASGDRALLERLVVNLLDNASRHNVPGGWVEVETSVRSGRPTLRVANSGPVIPPGRVPELLEPFQRLETGRKAVGDGLGLGLSIVAAVVAAHHGELETRALPEGGLEVTVSLDPPVDRVADGTGVA
ncbi:two-component sensor histidine kinase [Planobispora rosea]|uniref:histidine kinase n=1 Tax=Planobispora rosea TaxID=35762 RepID=A0A8J3S2P7_PLARO|nr:ATP-binding protein [Planobispora rosea]GGS80822.1 two-component sensor histidine kinase [Planobispora rosea]GIH85958.1 two-component sensor histidine kinase [Planobispora rosea]